MPNPSSERAVAEYFAALRAMDVERWINTFAPDEEGKIVAIRAFWDPGPVLAAIQS